MLGLVLIYFLGKQFYELAFEYKKSPWPYAILGVVVYYGFIFIGGFLIGVIVSLTGNYALLQLPEIVLGLMCIPVGLLAAWGLYKILQRTWKKELANKKVNIEILDEL